MTELHEPEPDVAPASPRARTRSRPGHLLLAATGGAAPVGVLWAGLDLAGSGGPAGPRRSISDARSR
ncbi:MAG: hypothetical protein QOI78_5277 [Actinomycetota bacterium]|nr:hypothetical protein [Actinomycetota bacterium]